jgi:ribosomal protein S18 acetylase RimI-like enzyme
MGSMVEIGPLTEFDRADWELLARQFHACCATEVSDDGYEQTWQRLLIGEQVRGIAARLGGKTIGVAHYLFHASVWSVRRCYLADLFVDPQVRRQGVATAMIDWVAWDAGQHGAPRVYWNTELDNAAARRLYDRVASFKGHIVYSYSRNVNQRLIAVEPGVG